MKIETTKDFKRPREAVLRNFRDPERYQSVLTEMGAEVAARETENGLCWDCAMVWRDERRTMIVTAVETAPDETFALTLASDLADAAMTLDFYDLPNGDCRVMASAELTAHTMMAKLALQSLRLVRGKAEGRLTRFISAIGRKQS